MSAQASLARAEDLWYNHCIVTFLIGLVIGIVFIVVVCNLVWSFSQYYSTHYNRYPSPKLVDIATKADWEITQIQLKADFQVSQLKLAQSQWALDYFYTSGAQLLVFSCVRYLIFLLYFLLCLLVG